MILGLSVEYWHPVCFPLWSPPHTLLYCVIQPLYFQFLAKSVLVLSFEYLTDNSIAFSWELLMIVVWNPLIRGFEEMERKAILAGHNCSHFHKLRHITALKTLSFPNLPSVSVRMSATESRHFSDSDDHLFAQSKRWITLKTLLS